MQPGGSIRPMIARPVTDFPAPDSPTTPRTSPLAMSKEIPSMARNALRRVTNSTRRLRTESTGSVMRSVRKLRRFSSEFWIERVAQPVAEQVDREDQARQRKAREGNDPPLPGKQIIVADPDQRAERGHGVGHAGAEEGERGFGDDGEREVDGRDHQDRPHRVRQYVSQHDHRRRKRDQDGGKGQLDVGNAHDQAVDRAAEITCDQPKDDTQRTREQNAEHANGERNAQAIEDRGKHIAALLIGAEQEWALAVSGPDRRDPRIHQLKLRRIERVLHGKQGREYREQKEQHGYGGRNHGEPGAAKRIEDVAVDGAPKPMSRQQMPARCALFGFVRDNGFGHAVSRVQAGRRRVERRRGSEERRVGKEWRSLWSWQPSNK